ncbi:hypothetical protein HK101_003198 [Irineochytrium annulatum]|nr:hypothetical protein HK101_003198 [Irineochytrium annulatum]
MSKVDLVEVLETTNASFSETRGTRTLNNHYELERELGRGSYGTVHRGRDIINGTLVAVKELDAKKLKRSRMSRAGFGGPRGRGRGRGMGVAQARPVDDQAESRAAIDLVREEIAIMKKLNHKNVVRLYEVLHDPKQESLFMVYDLCERGALMPVSLDTPCVPYTAEKARGFFHQIIYGIEYRNVDVDLFVY